MMVNTKTQTKELNISVQQRMAAGVVAGVLGFFMVMGVGFAQPMEIHNAAHDTRHAFTFPCH